MNDYRINIIVNGIYRSFEVTAPNFNEAKKTVINWIYVPYNTKFEILSMAFLGISNLKHIFLKEY